LSAVFKVSDYVGPPTEQSRVVGLQNWLAANTLDVGVSAIGPEPAIAQAAAGYSVKSAAPWLNLGRVTLPAGGDVAANAGLTLLQLPSELERARLANGDGHCVRRLEQGGHARRPAGLRAHAATL
jgi:hypothetical protein